MVSCSPFKILRAAILFIVCVLFTGSIFTWDDASFAFRTPMVIGVAHAAGSGPAKKPDAHDPSTDTAQEPKGSGNDSQSTRSGTTSGKNALHSGAEFSEQEIAVLKSLAKRRETLAKRQQDIGRREAVLRVAEDRIESKIARLEELRTLLSALIKQHNDEQEGKLGSLVKIYENMKPGDAARIFEELEMVTLLPVAERMKERKLAAIMAQMNPAKAKEMTVELAQQRSLIQGSNGYPAREG
jgi:flagellar motility protein MotE (MotC chaperone)